MFAKHEITHLDERGSTFELRGLEGCFGEFVIVTGTLRYKEHTMTSPETGNQDHMRFTFFEEGTAVGQATGRVWKFKEKLEGTFNTPNLAAPHATFTRTATHPLYRQRGQPRGQDRPARDRQRPGNREGCGEYRKGPCQAI